MSHLHLQSAVGTVSQTEFTSPPARRADQRGARRITTEGGGLSEAVLDLVDLQASLSGGNLDISPVLQCPGRKQPLI